jgi:hypothetical protein
MSQDNRHSRDDATEEAADSGLRSGVSRRRLLAAGAATWATVGLAGCGGNGGDGGSDGTATSEPEPANYVVTAETGTGEVPEGAAFASSCSASRRFVPGMLVVWYVGIYDPETGEQLTDEDLDSVEVSINGGETVELAWAGDDEENPADEWSGSWTVPEDTEPQTLNYEVNVTDGEANFRTVGILQDSIEIIEYSNPTNYVVTTNTFWNGAPDELPDSTNGFVGACAPEREFTAEMDVTFVIGIYDGSSGDPIGTDTLDSVTVESTDGSFDPVDLEFSPGGEDSAAQWSATLETENLGTGTYGYEVNVTDGEANFYNVGIASNQFTIIEV